LLISLLLDLPKLGDDAVILAQRCIRGKRCCHFMCEPAPVQKNRQIEQDRESIFAVPGAVAD
jgi:hypothetical protein